MAGRGKIEGRFCTKGPPSRRFWPGRADGTGRSTFENFVRGVIPKYAFPSHFVHSLQSMQRADTMKSTLKPVGKQGFSGAHNLEVVGSNPAPATF